MNTPSPNGGPATLFRSIQIKDFDVSWAGPDPFGPGYAFGSEDGRIVFTDRAGQPVRGPFNGSRSGEAINGIAGSGTSLAVSSRKEITVRTWTTAQPERIAVSGVPHGAHGIVLAPSGHYVAPLGRTGIMVLRTDSGAGDPVAVMTPGKDGMYFYRLQVQAGRNGRDLFLCANRQSGIGIAEVQWGQRDYKMRTATFQGLDVIDVCAVGGEPESPAVAAVGYDGTLILVRDALHDTNPVTMKYDTIEGTAYRVLSVQGHLFLLTSHALYGLMGLGERLLRGHIRDRSTTPIFVAPMDAVEANPVSDSELLVVMPDEVRSYDVGSIARGTPDQLNNGEVREAMPIPLTPRWEIEAVSQSSRELVTAGA
jgi:hypothetical protein